MLKQISFLLALLLSTPAHAASPSPNVAHAVGASKGVGKNFPLPFGQLSDRTRTGAYYIPAHRPARGRAVALLFHGFADNGQHAVNIWRAAADAYGIALVAPDALGKAWSVPDAGKSSADAQHAADALYWLLQHAGQTDPAHLVAGGHSYGCRMASYFGTNATNMTGVFISHGRFVPATLGPNKVPAWFSGSPKDNMFSFGVMKAQWSTWPRGHSSLHTYDCATCLHMPHQQEVLDVGKWVAGQ